MNTERPKSYKKTIHNVRYALYTKIVQINDYKLFKNA